MLISQYAASKLPFAPSKQALNVKSKKLPPPGFFVEIDGKMKIDINHPEWEMLIESNKIKLLGGVESIQTEMIKPEPKKRGRPKGKKTSLPAPLETTPLIPPTDPEEPLASPDTEDEKKYKKLVKKAAEAKLQGEINKTTISDLKIEQEKMELKKKAGQIAEFEFMNFLYFGYMEKVNTDCLGMMKRLEPILINLVKEGDCRGIIKRVNKELKSIFIEIKKSQSVDIKNWEKSIK